MSVDPTWNQDSSVDYTRNRFSYRRLPASFVAMLILLAAGGCATKTNPSFPLTVEDAKADIKSMQADPKPLQRPLVMVAGWGDPGFATDEFEKTLGPALDDDRTTIVVFKGNSFEECRDELISGVDEAFGSGDDEAETIEVDVLANSMGGVVARYAADPEFGDRRLKVARLFTISSPHRGAAMAYVPTTSPIVEDMRVRSDFIATLNDPERTRDYPIYPYVRLGDAWVGQQNTAPPGEHPWWVPNRAFEPAHMTSFSDPRFLADVMRRLRDETPYATEPRTPLP